MSDKINLRDRDINDFIQTLDTCKGNVYLETAEGYVLNLKSKLCQFAGLKTLIKGGVISDAQIRCELPEDETKLFRFNLYGEVPKKED